MQLLEGDLERRGGGSSAGVDYGDLMAGGTGGGRPQIYKRSTNANSGRPMDFLHRHVQVPDFRKSVGD